MDNLERELMMEKENYTAVEVPSNLKYSVSETLNNLPTQNKRHNFWSWNFAAAILLLVIGAFVFNSDIPYKIRNITQYASEGLSERLQGKKSVSNLTENINPYHPVIFSYKSNTGELSSAEVLGGSMDGRWFKISDFSIEGAYTKPEDFYGELRKNNFVDINLIKGGETFNFYSRGEQIAYRKAEKPTLQIPPANGEKILSVKIDPVNTEHSFIIGVNSNWNAIKGSPTGPYKPGNYNIDFNGDGSNEILKLLESKNKTGQSQIKVVIEINNKQIPVQDIVVDGIYTAEYDVSTLDLNGDGVLEIVIIQKGHNISVNIYELKAEQVARVLEYYNGD